ncbi:MAG: hypothetical protein CBB72_011865 [Muricauda sp. TMED12]|nr:MAG: hypothetical protein CBB72_011865 [Muricauda sp. TMED12]
MTPYSHIEIRNGNKTKNELVLQVVEFCKTKMFPRAENVELSIHLVKNLQEKEGVLGDCFDEGWREYVVRIDKYLDPKTMVETLCHELVHVKQYVKGQLHEYETKPGHRWQKTYIPADTNYADRPWEKEAFAMEKQLAMEFVYENYNILSL